MRPFFFNLVIATILLLITNPCDAQLSNRQKDLLMRQPTPFNRPSNVPKIVNKSFNKSIKTTAVKPSAVTPSVVTDNNDIRIFPSSNVQAEVHISINRSNPNIILASANTYTTTYSQGYYVSTNGGSNWTGADVLQNSGAISIGGDPSTAFDNNGKMYISTINANGGYSIQNSSNNGQTFSAFVNNASTETNFDKEMIATDDQSSSPYVNNIYCAWTNFGTPNTNVEFDRSTNGGTTFSAPVVLKSAAGVGQGTNVQTGPNGEVYVCWADYDNNKTNASGLGFTSSLNGGVSFSPYSRAFTYNGIRTVNGPDPRFNNIGMNDFPVLAVDKTGSIFNGRIYVAYPEFDANNHAIIRVRTSVDKGATWSCPTTISIANATQSFFPWITVDQSTGDVLIVYYAFDNPNSAFSTNTYVAHSSDGGATWENQKVSDVAHITAPINNSIFRLGYAGDYIGIAAYGGKAYPAWMDNRNGTWQIYVSPITYSKVNSNLSISGNDIICNNSVYQINNLPAGASVTWSIPSNAGGVLQLAQNTPSANQVTITNQKWYGVTTTLGATINTGGCTTAPTITKIIRNDNSSSQNNSYSYFQEACTFYGVSHPSQSGTVISNSSPIFVHQGCMVYVTLYDMNLRTVSLAPGSGQPLYWGYGPTTYSPTTLYFQLPYGSGGIPFTFNISGNGSCFTYSLLFFSYSNNSNVVFSASPNPVNDLLTVTANENKENQQESTNQESINNKQLQDLQFKINLYDFNTNQLQITKTSVKGTSKLIINTSNLKTGYYILQILYNNESQSIKIFKK